MQPTKSVLPFYSALPIQYTLNKYIVVDKFISSSDNGADDSDSEQ